VLTLHNPDHIVRKKVAVLAAAGTTQPMAAPPARAAQPAARTMPLPPRQEPKQPRQPKKDNGLEDLGEGVQYGEKR
jgi:hypothetical protein